LVLAEGSLLSVYRAFLAPTLLSNHLIQIEPDGNGACVINHQPMTHRQLTSKLSGVLFDGLDPEIVSKAQRRVSVRTAPPGKASAPLASEIEAPREIECGKCGQRNPPQMKFCGGCGSRLASPEPVFVPQAGCRKCGAALRPAQKFCTACGPPVGGSPK